MQGVVDTNNAGWCHLDLKLQNVCTTVNSDGELHAFLIDFGSGLPLTESKLFCLIHPEHMCSKFQRFTEDAVMLRLQALSTIWVYA